MKTEKRTTSGLVMPWFLTLALLAIVFVPKTSWAASCTNCGCINTQLNITMQLIRDQNDETQDHILTEFDAHEDWLLNTVWLKYILPAMMMMTEQMSVVGIQQMEIVGILLDAKEQLETQRLLEKMAADAHYDYQPSVGLCEVGTSVRSLAASERYIDYNRFVLSQRSQDRQLGQVNSSGSAGTYQDMDSRLAQFKKTYCDTKDSNSGLKELCDPEPTDKTRVNMDVDYMRVIDLPKTLDLDFCDRVATNTAYPYAFECQPKLTNTEEDLFALSNNIYSHHLMTRFPESVLKTKQNQPIYQNLRALVAKRSVAENSFNTIASLKSLGSPDMDLTDEKGNPTTHSTETAEYMKIFLKQLGITDDEDLNEYLRKERPSYYAQMEILTKRIFQRPEFYTTLYDTPANVTRKSVMLQAIDLMQDFDTLKTYLRTEMMLSILLELEVSDHQGEVENQIGSTRNLGEKNKKSQ